MRGRGCESGCDSVTPQAQSVGGPGATGAFWAEDRPVEPPVDPSSLFEHDIEGVQRVGIGVQAAGVLSRDGRFHPAVEAL